MPVDDPAGESPVSADDPVGTVIMYSANGTGDQKFYKIAKTAVSGKPPDGCTLMLTDLRFLSRPGCLDRFACFVFSRPQMLLCFRAMSCHVVVVRGASIFHLLDRFLDVVMALIQVVPVMHSLGNRDSCNESQARRKNGSSDCFIHSFSPRPCRLISCTHSTSSSTTYVAVKMKQVLVLR